jgi:hypothetical protein
LFVSKLPLGENISEGEFFRTYTDSSGVLARGTYGAWLDRGAGFVGFRFQGGEGIQYGWARVRMAGFDRHNNFQLLDYAFADPGEPILPDKNQVASGLIKVLSAPSRLAPWGF